MAEFFDKTDKSSQQTPAITSLRARENKFLPVSANKPDIERASRANRAFNFVKHLLNLVKRWGRIATAVPSRIAIASSAGILNFLKRLFGHLSTARLSRTQVENDIKLFLSFLYVWGYLLAVVPPNLVDPLLSEKAVPGPRHYEYWWILIPIGLIPCGAIPSIFLWDKESSIKPLYFSILVFELSIIGSLWWVFRPFPHGTPLQVGIIVGFLSAFTIYIWSIVMKIEAEVQEMTFPLGEFCVGLFQGALRVCAPRIICWRRFVWRVALWSVLDGF